MKLLIFSDSHGRIDAAKSIIAHLEGKVDGVMHLGDHDTDAERLQKMFPSMPFYIVRGNNDFGGTAPAHRMVTLGGKRLLMTHGHKHRVHWNLQTIAYWAQEQLADAVFFGHTHYPTKEESGGVLICNPGSISLPRDSRIPTFAILTIERGRMEVAIMEYDEKTGIKRRC
ncbi:metallophosphoesterase [Chakrabartyella piscis]|uniref:metallophosphoesterase family protein n=1 Tax=Chakrabartyella piscis TaxID=2918914 RepID=UPI002958580C|nr:metallophosphoesterase [Chakrabartyella piscis]